MSDAWEEIQAIKSKRLSLREKLQKRKKERQELLSSSAAPIVPGMYAQHSIVCIILLLLLSLKLLFLIYRSGTFDPDKDKRFIYW